MGIRFKNQRSIKNKISGKNLPSIILNPVPSSTDADIYFNLEYKGYINEQPVPTAVQTDKLQFNTATVAPSGATLSHSLSFDHYLPVKISGAGLGFIMSTEDTRVETFDNSWFAFVSVFDGADPAYSMFNLPTHNIYMVKGSPVDTFYALPKSEDAYFIFDFDQYGISVYTDLYELNMGDFSLGNRVVVKNDCLSSAWWLETAYIAVGVSSESNISNMGTVDIRQSVGIHPNIQAAIDSTDVRGISATTNAHDGGFVELLPVSNL
jgi:hypothetical protein